MKKFLVALALSIAALSSTASIATVLINDQICIPKRAKDGRILRNSQEVRRFKKIYPCPVNGKTTGSCPGYVVDHVQPLCACGEDKVSNMQWQSLADSKAKDKEEIKLCNQIKANQK